MRAEAQVRLSQLSHGAGCACKLGPAQLTDVLGRLGMPAMPDRVLVSGDTRDDAAVYAQDSGPAIVQTVDFFTPIVDDPYDWGRVAATNAMSDVYAMGGRPVMALNLVCWPVDDLSLDLLVRVLEGGSAAAGAAGVAVVGGHSITDTEPKYGMAVTGFVDPDRIVRNSTAPSGATLFLTKPLGLGIISTAIKRGSASEEQIRLAVDTMTELNAEASAAMVEAGVEAATDVTGFGLLGHLRQMLAASGVSATVDAYAVDLLPGVLELAREGVVPGGTRRNHEFVEPWVAWGELDEAEQAVLADAQTSGGLLIATTRPEELKDAFARRALPAQEIGTTHDGEAGRVTVSGRLAP
ncbi:MAG: selenide, water dikinase SelD [Actinomycetota bacterium]